MGALHYASFRAGFASTIPAFTCLGCSCTGLWYSATILAHPRLPRDGPLLACRYYRIDASLPFFLPAPLVLTGTLGAFIRIREPIPTKRVLFDIGIAGPIAGFVVAVPALLLGLMLSNVAPLPPTFSGARARRAAAVQGRGMAGLGRRPEGYALNLHPMAFAAWFGLLATALNLFPIGQLDGGHIAYAVLGRRATSSPWRDRRARSC